MKIPIINPMHNNILNDTVLYIRHEAANMVETNLVLVGAKRKALVGRLKPDDGIKLENEFHALPTPTKPRFRMETPTMRRGTVHSTPLTLNLGLPDSLTVSLRRQTSPQNNSVCQWSNKNRALSLILTRGCKDWPIPTQTETGISPANCTDGNIEQRRCNYAFYLFTVSVGPGRQRQTSRKT